jgi:hypothetical protein
MLPDARRHDPANRRTRPPADLARQTDDRRAPIDTCLAALEMQATVARMNALREKMRLPVLVL